MVLSGAVNWLNVGNVGWQSLILEFKSRPGTGQLTLQIAVSCDTDLVFDMLKNTEPGQPEHARVETDCGNLLFHIFNVVTSSFKIHHSVTLSI